MTIKTLKYWLGYKLADLKFLFQGDHAYNLKYFFKKKGYKLDLANPQTFSEKTMYLKEHYRNSLMTLCSDKYCVKEYLKLTGCEEICKKVYAVYKNVEDIEFDKLPEVFFIRCNHMSGCNFLYSQSMDAKTKKQILQLLKISLRHNWYHNQREWNYKNIEPLIICEEYLQNHDGTAPVDYKFYCFSGVPKYWMVSLGEYDHNVRNHKFDINCNSIDHFFKKKSTLAIDDAVIPDNYQEMLKYVEKLCKPFPHVRVDLYDVDGRIVFGELTFFSDGGAVNVVSHDFEIEIGNWIDLDSYRENYV